MTKSLGTKIMNVKKEVENNFCPKYNKASNCPKCPCNCLATKLGDIYFAWLTEKENKK